MRTKLAKMVDCLSHTADMFDRYVRQTGPDDAAIHGNEWHAMMNQSFDRLSLYLSGK